MKLYHLFPDLMNLYGDYGNLVVLKAALEEAGETVEVVNLTPDHLVDNSSDPFADADFLYMGPGTEPARDRARLLLLPHLDHLRTTLRTRQVPALFTGNSWSLLGETIAVGCHTTVEGLGIYPYITWETRDRYTGDAIAQPASEALPSQPVVGFLNRCDKVEGAETPLFTLTMGKGNDDRSPAEGFHQDNFYATHLTGPLLVKNPHLLNFFVSLLGATPAPIDETSHPAQAYQVTLQALQARLAN